MDADMGVKAKVSGYLEKKGKMKVMSSYKKYWFVLEDRLLLYYRSKDEYDSLSPCKGSINLGPPCSIKPCSSQTGAFQVETRRNTITLRAESRDDQNRWMQAIMSTLNQNNVSPARLSHFRYSLDEISKIDAHDNKEAEIIHNSDSTPSPSPETPKDKVVEKLQRMGAHSYLPSKASNIFNRPPNKHKTLQNRHSMSDSVRVNTYESSKRKSLSTEKLSSVDNQNIIITNETYFTIKNKIKSLSMERLPSIIIENDQYQTINKDHIYDNITTGKMENNFPDQLVSNDLYNRGTIIYAEPNISIQEEKRLPRVHIYSEPNEPIIDHNENVMIDNTIYTVVPNNLVTTNTDSDTILQGSPEIENKTKQKIKLKKGKSEKQEKNMKEKSKLEKKTSLIDRVLKRTSKKQKKKDDNVENIYEEVPVIDIFSVDDKDTIQILHELQHILEKKKPELKKKNSIEPDKIELNEIYQSFEELTETPTPEHGPLIPPKQQKQFISSPYHDIPKNNQPVNKIILPPKKRQLEATKSVDEILYDLEREEAANDVKPVGKVKKLVKQFSTNTLPPTLEEVVLRHRRKPEISNKRYSDELSILLEQLSKVTSAPLLTPGATTSLMNPNLSDDELLKLLPIRRRRFSEPDYDVPRPHKSLINFPKNSTENPIQATRFFGEVLPSEPLGTEDNNANAPCCTSITPDSLEVDLDVKTQHSPLRVQLSLDEERNMSYSSHNYYNNSKTSHELRKQRSFDLENKLTRNCNVSDEYVVNSAIYAQPKRKSQMSINFNSEKSILIAENGKSHDDFVDSLEIGNESTPF